MGEREREREREGDGVEEYLKVVSWQMREAGEDAVRSSPDAVRTGDEAELWRAIALCAAGEGETGQSPPSRPVQTRVVAGQGQGVGGGVHGVHGVDGGEGLARREEEHLASLRLAQRFQDPGAGTWKIAEEGKRWMCYEEWQCRLKEHHLELLRLREQIVLLEGVSARVCLSAGSQRVRARHGALVHWAPRAPL